MQWPVSHQGWSSRAAGAVDRPTGSHAWQLGDQHAVVVALLCAFLATLSLGLSVWIGQQHADGMPTSVSSWTLVVAGSLLALLLVAGGLWLTASRADVRGPVRSTRTVAAVAPDKDQLTGLLNRHAFMAFAEDAMACFQRYDHGFALLMVAVDDLAPGDRTLGSAAGDQVLGHVADVLDLSLRKTDKISRFDGDRFAVLLREISQADAMLLSDRMRRSVEGLGVQCGESSIPVTISIGVALACRADTGIGTLMSRADLALANARSAGPNRVCWQPEPEADTQGAERPKLSA